MALDGIRADAVFHLDLPGGWLDDATLALLVQEHHEFEAVLGVPVIFSTPSDGCPRWIAEAGGFDEPPSLTWDWDTLTLISRAGDHDGLMATFSLLQTLAHTRERSVRAAPAVTVADAVERVHHECATTYPYFGLRDLDWDVMWQAACGGRPRRWQELVPWASRLVAGLGDAHTAVLEKDAPGFSPLYTADLRGDGAHLVDVPRRSAAYAAGVRAGWVVCMDNPSRWFATVGASPQQHGRMAARRAMRISGDQRTFTALDPRTRREASWVETATPPGLEDLVSVRRNPSGAVLVTLRAFDSRRTSNRSSMT